MSRRDNDLLASAPAARQADQRLIQDPEKREKLDIGNREYATLRLALGIAAAELIRHIAYTQSGHMHDAAFKECAGLDAGELSTLSQSATPEDIQSARSRWNKQCSSEATLVAATVVVRQRGEVRESAYEKARSTVPTALPADLLLSLTDPTVELSQKQRLALSQWAAAALGSGGSVEVSPQAGVTNLSSGRSTAAARDVAGTVASGYNGYGPNADVEMTGNPPQGASASSGSTFATDASSLPAKPPFQSVSTLPQFTIDGDGTGSGRSLFN